VINEPQIAPKNDDISPLEPQNVVSLAEPKPSGAQRFLIETIETLALALVLFLVINFLTARIRVDGASMEPTFHEGDYVIVNRLAYRTGEIQRGDVIVFPFPNNPEEDFIKRVIGLSGDTIAIYSGVLYVNDVPLSEPYLMERPLGDLAQLSVPEGHVYVMGDNRNDSSDSRSWGPLAIDVILGKAVFRYWPFEAMGLVDHPVLAAGGE
jgi:signal peptidase I